MKRLLKTILPGLGLFKWVKQKRHHHLAIAIERAVGALTPGVDFYPVRIQVKFNTDVRERADFMMILEAVR